MRLYKYLFFLLHVLSFKVPIANNHKQLKIIKAALNLIMYTMTFQTNMQLRRIL